MLVSITHNDKHDRTSIGRHEDMFTHVKLHPFMGGGL